MASSKNHRSLQNPITRSRGSSKSEMDEVKLVRALVVDDDALVRRVHKALLNRYGLETEVAENGKEAVDLFLSGKTFDLVLMDMEMPVMDGLKATRELRKMGAKSMIVGITCGRGQAAKEAFIAAGLDDYMEKPINAQDIISMLDELAKKIL